MRVAFLTQDASLYGANRSLLALVDELPEHGVGPRVLSARPGPLLGELADRRVPAAVVPHYQWLSPDGNRGQAAFRLVRNAFWLLPLLRRLRAWEADVVYSNSAVFPIGLAAARVGGLPHVWHLRELVDLGWPATEWGAAFDWGIGTFRRLVGHSDAIVTVSDAVRRHLLVGRDARRARVIPSGVAPRAVFDRLRERARERRSGAGPYTFALVGELSPRKGQETALRALGLAARHHPEVALVLVGAGDPGYEARCRQLARDLDIAGRVEFRGYLEDPFDAYQEADAVLMCSPREPFGRVTVEAMAAGRPVIGHAGGGTPEIVEDGRTGLLYEGGPEELAACMERFLEDPGWARGLGEEGWRVARQRYTTETYAARVFEVLRTVVG